MYLRNCLVALLTPWGRLPAAPFSALCIVLIAAHCVIQLYLYQNGDDLPPYNAWTMSLFGVVWASFCVLSRRFHDAGKAPLFLLPLLLALLGSYIYDFDSLHIADSGMPEDLANLKWAEDVRLLLQLAALAAMAYASSRPGDVGHNAFGAEFYRPNAPGAANATPRVNVPVAAPPPKKIAPKQRCAAKEPRPARDFITSGPRGHITPAESTRRRNDGFGRR